MIKDVSAYEKAVLAAKDLAESGYLVTFGIQPDYPEPGFGYIQANGQDVLSFTEKPDLATAEKYMADGGYFWNSGMFCFKAGVFLSELRKYRPEIYDGCVNAVKNADVINGVIKADAASMHDLVAESIDYAVMENSSLVKMIACDPVWSDMGSYDAIYNEIKHDAADNAVQLKGQKQVEPLFVDSTNNLVIADNRKLALVGVEDFIVVDTADALLISKKNSSNKLRTVVQQLESQAPDLLEYHNMVHRPWGTYEILV